MVTRLAGEKEATRERGTENKDGNEGEREREKVDLQIASPSM